MEMPLLVNVGLEWTVFFELVMAWALLWALGVLFGVGMVLEFGLGLGEIEDEREGLLRAT